MTTVALQTFLYSYYANGVLVASDSLSNALYSSKWYAMLPVFRVNLIIFMERLKRRCQIVAGNVFAVNLELFTKVIHQFSFIDHRNLFLCCTFRSWILHIDSTYFLKVYRNLRLT